MIVPDLIKLFWKTSVVVDYIIVPCCKEKQLNRVMLPNVSRFLEKYLRLVGLGHNISDETEAECNFDHMISYGTIVTTFPNIDFTKR